MIVLWLLMMRDVDLELRSHVDDPVWRAFSDFVFTGSSLLLAVFFGAIIVTSEPLTELREDWQKVPKNHAVVVTPELNVRLSPV